MEEFNADVIEKMLQPEPSEKLLIKTLKAFKAKKKDRRSRMVLIIVCIILGIVIGMHSDTVSILKECIDSILNVLLSFFGIIFTGYALFQAFINKKLLCQLLKDVKTEENEEEKTRLQDINENFVYLMLSFIIVVIISLVIKMCLFCVPDNFLIFSNLIMNNIVSGIAIAFYFIPAGILLWRTVSFVSSIFHLFNMYAVAQLLEILDDELGHDKKEV